MDDLTVVFGLMTCDAIFCWEKPDEGQKEDIWIGVGYQKFHIGQILLNLPLKIPSENVQI